MPQFAAERAHDITPQLKSKPAQPRVAKREQDLSLARVLAEQMGWVDDCVGDAGTLVEFGRNLVQELRAPFGKRMDKLIQLGRFQAHAGLLMPVDQHPQAHAGTVAIKIDVKLGPRQAAV